MAHITRHEVGVGSPRQHEPSEYMYQQQLQQSHPNNTHHRRPSPRPAQPLPSPRAIPADADLLSRSANAANRNPTSPPLRGQHFDFAKPPTQYSTSTGQDRGPNSPRTAPQMPGQSSSGQASSERHRKPAGHTRSMSNPVLSLPIRGGRQEGGDDAQEGCGPGSGLGAIHGGVRKASDVTDDNFHQTIVPQRRAADVRGDGKSAKEALATGSCMTCATAVPFPKGRESFKCRLCITVTSLVRPPPLEGEFRQYRLGSHGAGSPPKQPSNWGNSRVPPILVEHARRLIRQCISTFIARRLRHPPSPGIGAVNDPSYRGLSSTNPFYRPRQASSSAQGGATPSNMDDEPTLRPPPPRSNTNPSPRSGSATHPERPPPPLGPPQHRRNTSVSTEEEWKRIFKPLEDYIVKCYTSFDCVNSSFMAQGHRPSVGDKSHAEASSRRKPSAPPKKEPTTPDSAVCDLDPKLLLMGTIAENGLLWMGGQPEMPPPTRRPSWKDDTSSVPPVIRPNQINWDELADWYSIITNCADSWDNVYEDAVRNENVAAPPDAVLEDLELQLLRAQEHIQKALIRATVVLLMEPGRPMTNPDDLRFLLIIMENPLLHHTFKPYQGKMQKKPFVQDRKAEDGETAPPSRTWAHSNVVKRILGLATNSSNECQSNLVAWFAKYPQQRFARIKDLAAGFLTHRLVRQSEKKPEATKVDVTAGLIPSMSTGRSAASLHAALGNSNAPKKSKDQPNKTIYVHDWQINAAARFLSLLFAANNSENIRRGDRQMIPWANEVSHTGSVHTRGQLLPTSDFYNTLLDLSDLVAEFQKWESRRSKFSFCQYPFLLSIWAKTQILEFDAKRQMETRARDAFFEGIMSRRNVRQDLNLDVRRDCLVEDSLKAVSEVIGSGGEDIKKRLRISFKGEEGVDAGGLRKEWFLLLVREVFDPHHGMFVYDEDSHYCYFNPHTFELSNQFFLVGVVLGLAIYNSTILDIALPPFAFRRLLASAPAPTAGSGHHRPGMTYTIDDLQEFRPSLAKGLRDLLDYDGDVEDIGLDFSITVDKYGFRTTVPLCPAGERKPVTNANRREYVDLYIRYLLETSVSKQFEPFKRGFWTVCGGNALTLFRAEEIELLVRGSDEALDVSALKAAAQYENWGCPHPEETEPVVGWFWEAFEEATVKDQHKLLSFITASDRIPAAGAALLPIKISCLGDDRDRFPIARTCFNMLSLFKYDSREQLESRLWRAVYESEGFGLK